MLFGHLYLLSCKENNKHFLSGLIFIHLQELYVLNMNLFYYIPFLLYCIGQDIQYYIKYKQ